MSDDRGVSLANRPHFARAFPHTPALDALVDAFARGDYARVRAEAPGLIASSEPDAVRDAARNLLTRTRPEPLSVALLAMAGALLIVLGVYWVAHGKAPPGSARSPAPMERVP